MVTRLLKENESLKRESAQLNHSFKLLAASMNKKNMPLKKGISKNVLIIDPKKLKD